MTDNQTLAVYDEKINDYIKLTEAPPSKSLLAFIQAIPSGGRVLDLGCGPGGAAAEMAQCGLKVDAIDGSKEMVDATKKYLKVTAWKATFHDLPNHPTYDGIYANFSLLHAKRSDFITHIKSCHDALFQGGIFHLGMKVGTGEKRDALGRFYTYYSVEELTKILVTAGFTLDYKKEGNEMGLAGEVEPFVKIKAYA